MRKLPPAIILILSAFAAFPAMPLDPLLAEWDRDGKKFREMRNLDLLD